LRGSFIKKYFYASSEFLESPNLLKFMFSSRITWRSEAAAQKNVRAHETFGTFPLALAGTLLCWMISIITVSSAMIDVIDITRTNNPIFLMFPD
jgi:hypothetical protein